MDLWAQAFLIDSGAALGRTMTVFKEKFFNSDFLGYKFEPKPKAKEKIEALLSPFTLSMQAQDYLEMPPLLIQDLPVVLPLKALVQYKELEKHAVLQLNDAEITALSAAALVNKLAQAASGFVYSEDGTATDLHDEKLLALDDVIEFNDQPLLVFYQYKRDLERLKERYPFAVEMDKSGDAVAPWNRGEIKILLAQPQSASHGLNLQAGSNICVWFSMGYSLEFYAQANARLYRQGQPKPVTVIRLLAKDTVDEKIAKALESKDATQASLLAALKSL